MNVYSNTNIINIKTKASIIINSFSWNKKDINTNIKGRNIIKNINNDIKEQLLVPIENGGYLNSDEEMYGFVKR